MSHSLYMGYFAFVHYMRDHIWAIWLGTLQGVYIWWISHNKRETDVRLDSIDLSRNTYLQKRELDVVYRNDLRVEALILHEIGFSRR